MTYPEEGSERRVDRVGRLERDMDSVKKDIHRIKGQLEQGDHTMNELKAGQLQLEVGQQLIARDLKVNSDTTIAIKIDTAGMVELFRNITGFRKIAAWLLGIIVAVSTSFIAVDKVYDKLRGPEAAAVVAPTAGKTR